MKYSKKLLLLIALLLIICTDYTTAQIQNQRDNIWLMANLDRSIQLDFSKGYPEITEIDILTEFEYMSTFMSNEVGELQYYSNGCAVFNKLHAVMEGGERLNTGTYADIWCLETDWVEIGHYPGSSRTMISLPKPHSNSEYFILHRPVKKSTTEGLPPFIRSTSYITTLNMNFNSGLGKVTDLRNIYSERFVESGMIANKHSNGEDWWIIDPLLLSDSIAVYLVDSTGINYHHANQIGYVDQQNTRGWDQSTFSPNGELFIRHNSSIGTRVFDFDRNSGELSNFRHIPMPVNDPQNEIVASYGGTAISPNGQFMYVCNYSRVFQYDLLAADVEASRTLIADIEYRLDVASLNSSSTARMQLGPDCKIYVLPHSGEDIHVIHNPNAKGAACDWEEDGLILPFDSFRDHPYFPVFRIGTDKDPVSPCVDYSLVSTEDVPELKKIVSVAPNPAFGPLTVSVNGDFSDPQARWTLYNANGRRLRSVLLAPFGTTTIPRADLPAGMYLWELRGQAGVLDRGKVIYQ